MSKAVNLNQHTDISLLLFLLHLFSLSAYLEGVIVRAGDEASEVTSHYSDRLLVGPHASVPHQTQRLIITEGPSTATASPAVAWSVKGKVEAHHNHSFNINYLTGIMRLRCSGLWSGAYGWTGLMFCLLQSPCSQIGKGKAEAHVSFLCIELRRHRLKKWRGNACYILIILR